MNISFVDKRVTGLAVVIPRHEQRFADDLANFEFSRAQSEKLGKVMGFDRHRLVQGGACSSDLALYGLFKLESMGLLSRDEIDALVFVTQTPDYVIPPTSMVIHGEFGLSSETICIDITQGCAGFLVGLTQACLLLDQPAIKKVLLINSDVISRKVSTRDRNSYPLIGDAASIVILERAKSSPLSAVVRHDGNRRDALKIPAGGMRLPSNLTTQELAEVGDGNFRALDHLVMDGSAVFNFVQQEVPVLIKEVFQLAKVADEDVFAYAFHQPNKFMLEKLCDRLGVSQEKMPKDIVERFGNSSGATIPMVLATSFRESLLQRELTYCLAGFGVGLTWAAMILNLGPLAFVEVFDDFGSN